MELSSRVENLLIRANGNIAARVSGMVYFAPGDRPF
jgi:hypothetical protein